MWSILDKPQDPALYPFIGVLGTSWRSLTHGHLQILKNFLTYVINLHIHPMSVHLVLGKSALKSSHLGLFFLFKTQVELALLCCILHNYILSGYEDDFIPSKEDWIPQRSSQTTVKKQREETWEWAARHDQIASKMWENK